MNAVQPRIALLIDADNAPASSIEFILTELATFGVTNVRRAYGNWKKENLKPWEDCLQDHAIRPMQQFDYVKKKNATDMALTVDALELLYVDRPDAFGIVSSDSDFTPLVMHLRSKGAVVYGFGEQKAVPAFVNACSRFLYLDKAPTDDGEPAVQPLRIASAQLRQDTRLMNLLRNAIQAVGLEDGWAKVGAVGHQIRNQASFDHRNYGYATLTKLIQAIGLFEMRDEGSSAVSVRDKRPAKGLQPIKPGDDAPHGVPS